MDKENLKKYAELVIKSGINVQDNQILIINSPIECAEFTRMLSEIAYKAGAREVQIVWNDGVSSRIKYLYGKDEIFDEFPEWSKQMLVSYAKKGAAFLSVFSEDPELMKGISSERIARASKARGKALVEYYERVMSDKNSWCVVSIPTEAWAKKVFADSDRDEAVEKLWEAIFKTTRATEKDPVAAWEEHKRNLKKRIEILHSYKLKYLIYKNSIGTDLKIELPKDHIWIGASSTNENGLEFIPNIPTEEIFTLPLKNGVNGKVVSTKPLNLNGNLVENFSFTFKDGRIIDSAAEKGYDVLKELIDTDEGSHYLGEVALVPYDSPISNSKILFYNTLFDENAACHLAIGKAYPTCLKNGDNMTNEELEKAGVNNSLQHEDFMIGSQDLNITGITEDGKEIKIFENGNFAF
ncbi:aminopeptidase [Clostridium sp. 19966]|uniref:aminopeptidase n=1 Tax=Clostridium sp. 19966 TaxID=2768166 RepID=UPI0028DD6193|nr:aminopeptidase [Clostridium sp. 19966]MDT8716002.1 aminopeptidase [Clostridium sp. 19966]